MTVALTEAKAAPQLLILAEPLLREGLLRILGGERDNGEWVGTDSRRYGLHTAPEQLQGSAQLVIWGVPAAMPEPTLLRELMLLRERWQPAPLLLLLPGESQYPHDWLLQLPAEGLLQQAEPSEICSGVSTLLAGGRVLELRPLQTEAAPQLQRIRQRGLG
ncbi:MAG: hypothetical protein EBR33_03510 [Synechococcaceae bacterium WB4_1_0192]|nr:hypothetical protein [Synechococcaceae bacterium WB4_1_0192]